MLNVLHIHTHTHTHIIIYIFKICYDSLWSHRRLLSCAKDNNYIINVPRVGNLYVFKSIKTYTYINNNNNNNNNDNTDELKTSIRNELILLHEKYTHVNYQKLYNMIKNNSIIINNKLKQNIEKIIKNKKIISWLT